jgi:hypothetical protein
MIGFVFSLVGSINEQDIESMLLAKEKFSYLSDRIALIITRCEHLSTEQRTDLTDMFARHKTVPKNDLLGFFRLGI